MLYNNMAMRFIDGSELQTRSPDKLSLMEGSGFRAIWRFLWLSTMWLSMGLGAWETLGATGDGQNMIPATPAQRQLLHGHVPKDVAHLPSLGRLPGTTNLNLAIGLPLRNQEALAGLLRKIYDPASPSYRHYLTPEQFSEQFGPAQTDYQAVINFVTAHGMKIRGTHPNRVVLDVEGSVVNIEQAFHVTMQTYRHPTEARTFHAPDTEPALDLAVPVLDISGLDNFAVPHPMSRIQPIVQQAGAAPAAGSGTL